MIIPPDERRTYDMGPRLSVTFMHDDERSAVSEWWLEPGTLGPGLHQHPDDALRFYGAVTALIHETEDSKEGPRAFAEKRTPKFQGR